LQSFGRFFSQAHLVTLLADEAGWTFSVFSAKFRSEDSFTITLILSIKTFFFLPWRSRQKQT
jgi:hypothetical protein